MVIAPAMSPTRPTRPCLAIWSLGLALGGGVLASVAAIAAAIVPPSWYVQVAGPSTAMPELALVARTSLVLSFASCFAALVIGVTALARGQRVWQVIVAVVTVLTIYPAVGAVYFVLGLFLYD